jgi:hemerythrin-like domain-containing protein
MDAITLLKQDHKTVERLFKQFEKSEDPKQSRRIADEIIKELSVHAAIEEQIFYPAVRQAMPDADETILEALEEHHVAKWLLDEIDGMSPTAERFRAKTIVLIESVRHHVEEEEQELFPEVRKEMKRKPLQELGAQMEEAKKTAPTKPHPMAPDEPPANVAASAGAAVIDRAKTAVKEKVGVR